MFNDQFLYEQPGYPDSSLNQFPNGYPVNPIAASSQPHLSFNEPQWETSSAASQWVPPFSGGFSAGGSAGYHTALPMNTTTPPAGGCGDSVQFSRRFDNEKMQA